MRDGWASAGEWLVIALAAAWVVFGTTQMPGGDTLNSRLASVYSLSVHGTWVIAGPELPDPNPFEPMTIDKVRLGADTYSTKPPVLPLLMTGLYQAMRPVLGWDIRDSDDAHRIGRAMSFVFSGGGYLLCLLAVRALLRLLVLTAGVRVLMLAATAFGTQLAGFATHFNNHVPAAGLAACAVYLAVGMGQGDLAPRPWRFALLGLTGLLAMAIDVPVGAFVGLAGLYALARFPKETLLWAGLAGAPVVLAHAAVLFVNTGSPLPVQLRHDELYLSEDAYWRIPGGIDAMNEPKPLYLFHMTFGRSGVFVLYPVLLLGLWGIACAAARRMPGRGLVLAGAVATAAIIGYYVTSTNNYGGSAYGVRWFIVTMPFLLVMGAVALQRVRGPVLAGLVLPLLAVSAYSAYECSQNAWKTDAAWTARIFGPAVVLPELAPPGEE